MKKLTDADPETQSANGVSDNLQTLATCFPDAVVEGRVNFEVLRQLLGDAVSDEDEKYGLNWHGKTSARQIALTPSSGTLLPAEEESLNWTTTSNLIIEGDNLEVLKLMQKSYSRKVRVIYIDPPYNTGNDLVYPDNYQDGIRNYLSLTGQLDANGVALTSNTESSGRFHTKWLSMIYPRLKLAHSLLADNGVMLVSIDDTELPNLLEVARELFGEENFVATLVWEKGRKNDAKLFSLGHEYLVIFARSMATLRETNTLWREEKPGAREIWEKYVALRGVHGTDDGAIEREIQTWFAALPSTDPSKKWSRYRRIDGNGPWRDRDISWPGGGGPRYDVIHPRTGLPCAVPESGWRYASIDEMQRQIALGLVQFRDDHTQPPFRKAHIRPIFAEVSESADDNGEDDEVDDDASGGAEALATQVRGTYFYKQSQVAVRSLRELMGNKVFNNPKDHIELARLFDYVSNSDPEALFLDFFAGSGSTGHAVLHLNSTDAGRRRYILVQLPEPLDNSNRKERAAVALCDTLGVARTIAELTKERLRRASRAAIEQAAGTDGEPGFRVFKLNRSNFRAWEPNRDDVETSLLEATEHVRPGRTENDILCELLLKRGLDLAITSELRVIGGTRVHSIGAGTLIVCLSEHIGRDEIEKLALGIASWRDEIGPASDPVVIFRDSAFADDVAKTNMTAILEQHGMPTVRSV